MWGYAVLAALSPFLLFQFAWNLHEGVTHSMVLTCLVAASLWAVMRITEKGSAWNYLLFGLIVGLGLHQQMGLRRISCCCCFIAAMLQPIAQGACRHAAFSVQPLRSRGGERAGRLLAHCRPARSRRALWSAQSHPRRMTNRLHATLIGLGLSIYAPLGFLFPLDVILPVLFPASVPQGMG